MSFAFQMWMPVIYYLLLRTSICSIHVVCMANLIQYKLTVKGDEKIHESTGC
jgi:hypothetical protein